MKQSLRNQLYNTVVECRRLLERDFSRQIEGIYGVHADGAFEPIEHLTHLDAVGRADCQAMDLNYDLNDGVLLNIAPFHELVPWKYANGCRLSARTWERLQEGEYDWSSMASQMRGRGLVP